MKRYLIDRFVRDKKTTADFHLNEIKVLCPGFAEVPLVVSSPEADVISTLRLSFTFLPDGGSGFRGGQQLKSLVVDTVKEDSLKATSSAAEHSAEAAATRPISLQQDGGSTTLTAPFQDGPKWETDDGRVVQKIWQQTGCFDIGNSFLIEKMELTTGRLIVIIDQNVWDLYSSKIQDWCDHNDLKLEAVVRPGNEDQKTMDNCMVMLDELKRIDPLRRSEPVLAIGGGVLTDVAGFACALWRRGVPWCRMPTVRHSYALLDPDR